MSTWEKMLVALREGHETGDYIPFIEAARECAIRWYRAHYRFSEEDSETLANDVAIKLWVHAPRIRLDSAERYIRRSIANTARTWMRQRARHLEPQQVPWIESLRLVDEDEKLYLHAEIAHMSEIEQEIIHLLLNGHTLDVVRRELALSKQELDTHLESIRRRLR